MKALLAIASVCLCGAAVAHAQEPSARNKRGVPAAPPAAARAADAVVPVEDRDYKIGPEDVLDISVWKNEELSRTVPVRPDGKVSLPLVNDIQAAGLTPSRLREELTRRLSEYVPSPEVAVIVREVHSAKVSVVGAVRSPGRYEVRSPATVLELIALAQGFTDFAARDRIVVLRQNGTPQRITFNYRKITDGTDQDNFFVQAGDIIVVP
ncbi:MAG TPA: polysaccharide biosynthesis/export family protein [Vicinamibacterales bacterium]|nr:polysaccharide biosynthesis/export family protein [Vicinamibacterales bacterium]